MSETETGITANSFNKGLIPSLKAMLDYFGDRVESVEMVRTNGTLQVAHKITVRSANDV